MKREYRKRLEDLLDEADVERDIKVDVMVLFDKIEADVNEIRNDLEPFRNLTEIEDIYQLVDTLSKRLY